MPLARPPWRHRPTDEAAHLSDDINLDGVEMYVSSTAAGGVVTLRLVERFAWTTREGRGTNTFDECPR